MDNFEAIFSPEDEALKKEKNKARLLRQSQWWKRRRSQGICYYCRKQCKPADLTMDHILPLARGGRSSKGNVAPACKDCNNKKKASLPMDWETELEQKGLESPSQQADK